MLVEVGAEIEQRLRLPRLGGLAEAGEFGEQFIAALVTLLGLELLRAEVGRRILRPGERGYGKSKDGQEHPLTEHTRNPYLG